MTKYLLGQEAKDISLIFRNSKSKNNKLADTKVKLFNFVKVNLSLKLSKIDKITARDIELLKALQAER